MRLNFLGGVLLGTVIGTAIGLMAAPASGKQIRKRLKKKTKKYSKEAVQAVRQYLERKRDPSKKGSFQEGDTEARLSFFNDKED